MRFAVASAAFFALAACQTPCPAPETGPRLVNFSCEDGSQLRATFTRSPDQAQIAEDGYPTLTLTSRISGASSRYIGGGAELRWRGGDTAWTRPGGTETLCEEVR